MNYRPIDGDQALKYGTLLLYFAIGFKVVEIYNPEEPDSNGNVHSTQQNNSS